MHSIEASAAVTCCVSGSDCAGSSPWMYRPLKLPSSAASNMFGMRRPGSTSSGTPQRVFEHAAHARVGHVTVAAELVRERSHVAGALHVVLAAQRVDADAFPSEIAGGHREIRDAHHHRRALAVLGDAEAVVDGAVAGRRVETRRLPHQLGLDAGERRGRFGRVALLGDERLPLAVRLDLAARRRRSLPW